jgi:hypothetical protein
MMTAKIGGFVMRRHSVLLPSCLFVLLCSFVLLTQSGCEEASGIGGLELDPSAVSLATAGESVVLTVVDGVASDLALPLAWRVNDPNLGQIVAHSGYTAVYRRTSRNGANTVTVRDQLGNEGYVAVTQQSGDPVLGPDTGTFRLVAEPTTIQPNQGATIRIEGDGGRSPFNWSLVSGPGSLSANSGSRSASYAAGASTGVAQIAVTDVNGVSASVAITVQAATTGGSTGGTGGGSSNPPVDP